MGAAAYLEPVFNIIRHLTNGFNLFQKRMRIYDYPVPDNTGGIPIKNTGRYEVQYNLFIIKFKSMSGICASLIPEKVPYVRHTRHMPHPTRSYFQCPRTIHSPQCPTSKVTRPAFTSTRV